MTGAAVRVVALRPVGREEELCLDYATLVFRDDPYCFRCHCGARRCRGMVRGTRQ